MKRDINIGNYTIGENHKPFIIAEMSGNHNQSLDRALNLVDEAAKAGAHALKLQTYTPDTITIKGAFTITDDKSLWKGKELYDLYKEAYTPWEWHNPIFERAKMHGMVAFSSPFDESAVDFLESLNVPAYKIASFENTDWTLLKKVATTRKPIIVSTGVANLSDIDETVRLLRNYGCEDIILLKCTSTYPALPINTNLFTIPVISKIFNCHVGLSDHTMGIGASVGAVALGARIIEKHFTISRSDGGVDSSFSLEPNELKDLVVETERCFQALGEVQFGIQDSEKQSLIFKRSLFAITDIKLGEKITMENVGSKRPSRGLHTRYLENIINKSARVDIKKGTPIDWSMIDL
jgi:pseudaminic acid synthase